MKTPHRIMKENLTPEQYKRYCRNKVNIGYVIDMIADSPSRILGLSFIWDEDGEDGHEYWRNIYFHLIDKGL